MDAENTKPVSDPADLGTRVRALIAARDVSVVFQPIVDLQDGLIAAYEALSRPGPTGGFKHAGELFEAAESSGTLWDLEMLTRGLAFDAAMGWPRDTKLFLNCTPQVLADPRFPEIAAESVRSTCALDPDQIVFEITELSDEQMFEGLPEQVRRLKEREFPIAIDDVGAGASGMNRIMLLRPHWLKLDREFIAGIHADQLKQNLVKFFVHFARLSGVAVIAEGIETKEELGLIISLGVRYGQGFYLAKPAPRDRTTETSFADEVRQRWASVEAEASQDPEFATLSRLCKSVRTVQSLTPIATAAAAILPDPTESGFVVLEGRRFVGWCTRAAMLRDAAGPHAGDPIVGITTPGVCTLMPDASVQDALQLICVRQDEELTSPIVVADQRQVVGIVLLRDLLQAAAAGHNARQALSVALTGLPAKTVADRHLSEKIQLAQSRSTGLVGAGDAALIDIRRFGDFNAAYGYQLGDRLIRKLSDMLRAAFAGGEAEEFLAHLGDDRFLITSSGAGCLAFRPKLEKLMRDFDARPDSVSPEMSGGAPALSLAPRTRVSLRVLLLSGVFERIRGPRDFYRIEQQLRQKSRAVEEQSGTQQSVLVEDTRHEPVALRMTA